MVVPDAKEDEKELLPEIYLKELCKFVHHSALSSYPR